FFENMATAQFDHRVLAITTFCAVVLYWWFAWPQFPQLRQRRAANLLLLVAVIQVSLGISTLLLRVPTALGAAHQAVGLTLFTVALYLLHASRYRWASARRAWCILSAVKICLVTAELAPLAKTGGLADVCAALARFFHATGHDVRVLMPRYASLDLAVLDPVPVDYLQDVPVRLGGTDAAWSIDT